MSGFNRAYRTTTKPRGPREYREPYTELWERIETSMRTRFASEALDRLTLGIYDEAGAVILDPLDETPTPSAP